MPDMKEAAESMAQAIDQSILKQMSARSPDAIVAEAMVDVGDIDAFTKALDNLYKNYRLRDLVYGYDAPNNVNQVGAVMLQVQGILHVAKLRIEADLAQFKDDKFKDPTDV